VKTTRRWQDWITTLIGAMVALSPFVLLTTWNATEAWVAYIAGGLTFAAGAMSLLVKEATYLEVVKFVMAIVLFCTPWLFGFVTLTWMAWVAWVGAVALFLVLATLVLQERPTLVRTA
jgi:hypothetical protein